MRIELKSENCLTCLFGGKPSGRVEKVKAKCNHKDSNVETEFEDGKWFCSSF